MPRPFDVLLDEDDERHADRDDGDSVNGEDESPVVVHGFASPQNVARAELIALTSSCVCSVSRPDQVTGRHARAQRSAMLKSFASVATVRVVRIDWHPASKHIIASGSSGIDARPVSAPKFGKHFIFGGLPDAAVPRRLHDDRQDGQDGLENEHPHGITGRAVAAS
jgi:hypothetical protein